MARRSRRRSYSRKARAGKGWGLDFTDIIFAGMLAENHKVPDAIYQGAQNFNSTKSVTSGLYTGFKIVRPSLSFSQMITDGLETLGYGFIRKMKPKVTLARFGNFRFRV